MPSSQTTVSGSDLVIPSCRNSSTVYLRILSSSAFWEGPWVARPTWFSGLLLKEKAPISLPGCRCPGWSNMKRVRTGKNVKMPIKNSRQRILGQAFGTDQERVKPFSEDDRGEDRRFENSLSGFRYKEEKHEASRYLSKTLARVTLFPRGRVTIPREVRARLGIKPGQTVSITAVDGAVHIVPIRQSRRSERGRSFS